MGIQDGNKRSGLNAALVFLLINGWHVADPAGLLYDAMIAIFREDDVEV